MALRTLLLPVPIVLALQVIAQKPDAARMKVEEGIALHDKQDYKKAIKKYDEALELDQENGLAMAEKALSLSAMGRNEEAAALCQEIIRVKDGAKGMPMVYVTYGNCMDALGRPEAALQVYDQGIKVMPDLSMLHFNKGITLLSMDSLAGADRALQASARLAPFHPGTQNAMATLLQAQQNNVPAVLALCRFLVIEPEGARAEGNTARLLGLMAGNTTHDKKGNMTISVDASRLTALEDTTPRPNDFRRSEMHMELVGGLGAAAAISRALKKEGLDAPTSSATDLNMQLQSLSSSLKEARPKGFGFYWDYHATWFLELEKAGHLEVLSHLAVVSKQERSVSDWLEQNRQAVDDYYSWEKDYTARMLQARKE
ncbi:MAG TPA: tetratricopeptide repeat protein [Flavobacteriales bacterium]